LPKSLPRIRAINCFSNGGEARSIYSGHLSRDGTRVAERVCRIDRCCRFHLFVGDLSAPGSPSRRLAHPPLLGVPLLWKPPRWLKARAQLQLRSPARRCGCFSRAKIKRQRPPRRGRRHHGDPACSRAAQPRYRGHGMGRRRACGGPKSGVNGTLRSDRPVFSRSRARKRRMYDANCRFERVIKDKL
jgi:hypothetical protein